ncbi:spheroidene monooxygenase [Frankia sp. AgB1.9]|uniref:spheroidene monooxygenase n=1 Tax=unclassified Frankia TaxID=2632575 RepID=UPI0019333F3D|nr:MULTISPECIES: spheroidene monooxygenase [unclassified Frankia]MBL7488725.1 spheroidene monooxygenase [Frankia sp. AgW1.1]MBL7546793.1 spheroidene monooxygenase [Frankia sp. AgB1.9]MBL7623586.1 spheroidene monooxygenase [Frankia sp. AgB1.8]
MSWEKASPGGALGWPPGATGRPLVTVDLWRVPTRRIGGALGRMALDRARLRRVDGLTFARLVGTGTPGAFAPRDAEPRRWGLVSVWDSPAAAEAFGDSPVARSWARIADEHFHVELCPLAWRGRWSGREPFGPPPAGNPPAGNPADGNPAAAGQPAIHDRDFGPPVVASAAVPQPLEGANGDHADGLTLAVPGLAGGESAAGETAGTALPPRGPVAPGLVTVLTRARLAPRHAVSFWRAAPAVAADLAALAGTPTTEGTSAGPATPAGTVAPTLAIGIGEAPIGLQGTFSVWPSLAAVRAFAYRRPAHAAAVRRTGEVGWYAEELFARFAVLAGHGTVDGRDPLRPDGSTTAR